MLQQHGIQSRADTKLRKQSFPPLWRSYFLPALKVQQVFQSNKGGIPARKNIKQSRNNNSVLWEDCGLLNLGCEEWKQQEKADRHPSLNQGKSEEAGFRGKRAEKSQLVLFDCPSWKLCLASVMERIQSLRYSSVTLLYVCKRNHGSR